MDLHGQIMNIPADSIKVLETLNCHPQTAYKFGHRDARHAAAELALKANACIEALRDIVEQQHMMGFDGSPPDELMAAAKAALKAVGAA